MIREQVLKDLKSVLKKLKISDKYLLLEHPANPEHGDYSTNIALRIKRKELPVPLDLANHIVNTWRSQGLPEYLAKIKVVKPGFINLWLKNEVLSAEVERVLKEKDKYGFQKLGKGKTIIVEYSSPNIAKPFGIGLLRSTIIGQALYNLYQFLGWRTVGDSFVGDWGTQFGKMIVAIKKWWKKPLKSLTIADLEKLYIRFHRWSAKNPKFEDEARAWFKKLEEGDKEAREIWQACVEISKKEFARIYQLLGVKIDHEYGESFYQDKMPAVIEEAKKKSLAKESQGALVIEVPEVKIPLMLLKSDGATTYETRDLACLKYRLKRWKPKKIIYEVGAEQALRFQLVFGAARLLGWGKGVELVHIKHGLYRFPTGKMSTRAGKTIHLEDVLTEAVKRAQKIIESSQTGRGLSRKEKKEVAQAVGIGAIKYFDLSHHPQTEIVFDWEKIFVLEGNSAPYLQYTYARCKSVLRKSSRHVKDTPLHSKLEPEELAILRTLYRFSEVIEEAAGNYSPNLLCSFLFDLAQKYNLFYNRLPILKAEKPELVQNRLVLTVATAQVLKNGLTLLGIQIPERM